VLTFGEILRVNARRYPSKTAVVDRERRLTYGELELRTNRLAHGLAALGVGRGETVGMLVGNSVLFVELYLAIVKLGAIAVPFNTRHALPELAFALGNSRCRVLLADRANGDRAQTVGASERVLIEGDSLGIVEGEGVPETPPEVSVSADDPNVILYTSGTTGAQKGVVLSHANLVWNSLNEIVDTDMRHDDVTLLVTPMYHSASLNCWFAPHLYLGATSVMLPHFDPGLVLHTIGRERVTNLFHVPSMVRTLLQEPGLEGYDLRSLARLYVGGAAFRLKDKLEVVDRLGSVVRLYYQYGLTEAGPIATVLRPEDMFRTEKDGSIGREFQATEIRVLDQSGAEVLPGEVGEMVMRGPAVMQGYFQNPAASAAALQDGWLHSGDLAARDQDGYFYFRDRLKDMIKSGGENVYSAEVEQVLYAHPDVQEAAVVGVASERWDEEVRAVVVPRPGRTPTEADLIAFCRAWLAGYKIPKRIAFVTREEMPINLSGKVLKRELTGRIAWDR
jgi:fatty-acyl-CoA synthase